MDMSFYDLQMLAESTFSIEETREDLNEIVEFFKQQDYHDEAMRLIVDGLRHLPRSIADEADIFFINDEFPMDELPEKFKIESLGIVKKNYLIYQGRLVYPVKDVRGDVMGFCGWEPDGRPKYLDSRNHGYKAKFSTLYGMENLFEYYNSKEPVYVPEGIVCSLWLRSQGLQSLALLGSNITFYVKQVLSRFGDRLVLIPDNDAIKTDFNTNIDSTEKELTDGIIYTNETKANNQQEIRLAGEHLVKQAKRYLPKAKICQCTLAKDPDDTRLLEDGKYADTFVKDLKTMSNPFIPKTTIRIR